MKMESKSRYLKKVTYLNENLRTFKSCYGPLKFKKISSTLKQSYPVDDVTTDNIVTRTEAICEKNSNRIQTKLTMIYVQDDVLL